MAARVVVVLPVSGELGGIETYALRVANALKAHDDLEAVLGLKRTARFRPRPEFTRAFASSGVETTLVDPGSGELRKLISSATLVHLQNYSPDVAAMALVLRRPLLLTVHGHKNSRQTIRSRAGSLFAGGAVGRWYNSQFTWDSWEAEQRSPTSRRVSMRTRSALKPLPPSERSGFVFAARWVANKGVETLVEAYAHAQIDKSANPLTLLGDGPLRDDVMSLAQSLGVVLRAPGYVEDSERWREMRKARWLVAPSNTSEDLGLTPLEGRTLGVPAIVTRDGGLPEAAGCPGLVATPGDVRELTTLLELAANMDESTYARWSAASLEHLDRNFPPMEDEHPRLYRELLAGFV